MSAEPMSDLETRAGWSRANLIDNGVLMAELGFGILRVCHPTDPGSEWPCSEGARHRNRDTGRLCPTPGKRPIENDWAANAEHDPERVRKLLSSPGNRSYGITPPPGTFEWDVDGTAPDRLRELTGTLGPLPRTRVHKSGNGKHVFYRWPESVTGGDGNLFEIVTRWPAKGMVIGPGSVHATSGRLYTVESDLTIAELPETWARAAAAHHAEERERDDSGFRVPLPGEGWYYVVNSWCGRLRVIERTDGEAWARVQELAPGITDWETRSDFGDGCRGRDQHLRHTFDSCWADAVRDIPPGGSRPVVTNGGGPSVSGTGDPVAASTRKPPPFRTAREVATETPAEPDWTVRGVAAAGVITGITGKIKRAGKTTFTWALVRAVVEGAPFLGLATKRTAVVYVTEQSGSSLRVALARAGLLDREDVHVLTKRDVAGRPWPEVTQAVAEHARDVGAGLVIIDTLSALAGLAGDTENDAGAIVAIEPLAAAAFAGVAVVIVAHDRKSGGEVGDSWRGSSAIGGAVDVIVQLSRDAGATRKTIRKVASLSRFDETPDDVWIELGEDGRYVTLGDSEAAARDAVSARVAELLPVMPADGLPMKDIEAALDGTARAAIRRAMDAMLKAGEVVRTGEGKAGKPYLWSRAASGVSGQGTSAGQTDNGAETRAAPDVGLATPPKGKQMTTNDQRGWWVV